MTDALATLIRLRGYDLDALKRHLAELVARQEALAARLAALATEVNHERAIAAAAPLAARLTMDAYLSGVEARRAGLAAEIAAGDAAIASLRDAMAAAFAELKRLEVIARRRDERLSAERRRRDRGALDAVAIAAFNRHRR